jgi:predicted nucleic acid-binding protein
MKLKNLSIALGAVALASAPAIAQVASAPSIAPLVGDESKAGDGKGIILGLIAAAAIIGGIILATDDNGVELPVSN